MRLGPVRPFVLLFALAAAAWGPVHAQDDEAATREASFWARIADSDDPALFEAYLAEVKAGLFPGAYAAEAEARLDALTAPEAPPEADSDGFITRKSGLRYKVLTAGGGAQPGPGDMVRVHYEGRLADGTVFDSTYDRDKPAVFAVRGVIRGWQEALLMMREGDKWLLEIPSYLAYGKNGTDTIPPDADLTFEVELIKITFRAGR
ncbi:FKBP-type peptidyl-prolyl cis-trans isomerase [Rhodothalassium salexigens DSM 2132]|uniref:Peptidyl-prolyl cis-trans isomerase n=1 Tax=Rhodothalassium salexigens DSM 2132 TaxID=1188247 RepID=A0A4R2P973_RHOSA|nr:FKBP-type peptidyl-prolyl cis-trans isomerase [Rhodothalassium salexigens]MBB4212648.1 FKBP-type peptidyl-prolyl cis-trans isomerase [Rhodothalassium salexigens DSM 2132]MBK1638738.1 hypothetical protein [Rhodothalassium salexigens DSM 2132]TCP30754.1 FKBP-type peptidyl-prolyl cis-trans isomerase [Rhodothalassium salexigens DSM 2132]